MENTRASYFANHPGRINSTADMTIQERNFVFEQREKNALKSIIDSHLQDFPVFLIYGAAHTFIDTFDQEGSPALYRKFDASIPIPNGAVLPTGTPKNYRESGIITTPRIWRNFS